jgi:hypothetical protein
MTNISGHNLESDSVAGTFVAAHDHQGRSHFEAIQAELQAEHWNDLRNRPAHRRHSTVPSVPSALTAREEGRAWLERQRRETLQRETEIKARLFLRVHRHEFQNAGTKPGGQARTKPACRSRGPRGTRPAPRKTAGRARAPSGDSSPGEPESDFDGCALCSYLAGIFPVELTPRAFYAALQPFDLAGGERATVFAALPARLRRSFWSNLEAEIDRERVRVGHATWAPRKAPGPVGVLGQLDRTGGAL